jgi:hypothetical protein
MDSLHHTSPELKSRRLRLRLLWLVLALAFSFFGIHALANGRTSIRAGHRYYQKSDPAMFWLITSAHFGMAAWLYWKAATQRIEPITENA